jgi:hypothetical protein
MPESKTLRKTAKRLNADRISKLNLKEGKSEQQATRIQMIDTAKQFQLKQARDSTEKYVQECLRSEDHK